MTTSSTRPAPAAELRSLAALFLRLGTIAFGGPAAHIALFEDEVVRRRKWLTQEEFLDLLGATNLIPGPNSTEMAIHIGHRRAGWPGLVVAGVCFIVPAVLIVIAFAWAYVRFGTLPAAGGLLYGVKPVIIAIVLQALWRLGRAAVKSTLLGCLAIVALVLALLGMNELLILFGAGALMLVARAGAGKPAGPASLPGVLPLLPFVSGTGAAAAAAAPFGLWPLFLFFIKVGSILFGSGYVLLAFLRSDLVERWGWLTENQLLDAIAVGQITPGPLFTTATFIGYLLGGLPAAGVATIGIFLPAFVFVAISAPFIPGLRRSRGVAGFLDGVNVASLALMAAVSWQLARVAIVDWATLALAISSAFLILRYRLNSTWLVLGGAAAGLILHVARPG
jgi:chromate transporter